MGFLKNAGGGMSEMQRVVALLLSWIEGLVVAVFLMNFE